MAYTETGDAACERGSDAFSELASPCRRNHGNALVRLYSSGADKAMCSRVSYTRPRATFRGRDDQQLTSPRLRDPFRSQSDPRTSRACGTEGRKHRVIKVSNIAWALICSCKLYRLLHTTGVFVEQFFFLRQLIYFICPILIALTSFRDMSL